MSDSTEDDLVEVAVDAVAGGRSVDWDALLARANDSQRQHLANLRLVAAIKRVHDDIPASVVLPAAAPSHRSVLAFLSTPEALPLDSEGRLWDRYERLVEVGAGSFGRVYKAWDSRLERVVAIKILHLDATETKLRQRLLHEGKQLARLRDANIVQVWDVEERDGLFALVMEFVEGETLDDVLRARGTLNAREAILVGQDVLRALSAAHVAGLVHRDVKARNIMRDRTGRIMLMDFGAGRELEELDRADAPDMVGTPLYMAPELLAGRHATFGSDLYSLGVLLYYLVTGKYPVNGATLQDIRLAHMYGNRTPLSHRRTDVPPAFFRIVDRALAADPEQRYKIAGAMLDDLSLAIVPLPAPAQHSASHAVAGALAVAAVLIGVTVVGGVNSAYYHVTMGTTAFATGGAADSFGWGVRSLVLPTILALLALIGLAIVQMATRLLCRLSSGARRIQGTLTAGAMTFGLGSVDRQCYWALLASVALVAAAYWYHSDLLDALFITPDVSRARLEQLRRLSPSFSADHHSYRMTFIGVVILCSALWWPPLRLAGTRGERLNRILVASGAAVWVIAMLLLSFPYRLLTENVEFEVVRWQGARCYLLGQQDQRALLFCAERDAPRSVEVPESEFEHTGHKESPFAPFADNFRREGS
jgi:hypothetical protein